MAGLSVACLLARDGFKPTVLERNWLPGGCSSAYPRKGYVFESGATTLVGLSPGMPLWHVLQETGISVNAWELDVPMKVHLPEGEVLTRHGQLDAWIEEAMRVFGPKGQRGFWQFCYRVSQFVWETSLQQRHFPPSNWKDLLEMAKGFRPRQLRYAGYAFMSMDQLLSRYGLHEHPLFRRFVDEQLLITAQNYAEEVNVLFGATALCYTLFPNYYVPGGLIELVKPMVEYIEAQGGEVVLRAPVAKVRKDGDHYEVQTRYRQKTETYRSPYVISSIPINNTLQVFEQEALRQKYQKRLLDSPRLNSAFQLGLVFKKRQPFDCLHHQIHLQQPLAYTGSHSIFLSVSHPDDQLRCGPDEVVGSVSTHVPDPAATLIHEKEAVVEQVLEVLDARGLVRREDVRYHHASTPHAWEKWTGRAWGFVGGYPQYLKVKPWQMLDARLDHEGAYICGDSTYPGQGIPGACLSGIIAYEKIIKDVKPA